MDQARFRKQLDFIVEVDKVKEILRKSKLFTRSRYENDAEHSWTICLMAVLLREYANDEVNLERVMKMLLIHDIVEIDAGDTFLYAKERATVRASEEAAARRIFGLLEEDQAKELYSLWIEFEERATSEAKYARVLDRLEPIFSNYVNEGYTWKEHGISLDMVIEKNGIVEEGSKEIWAFVRALLDECVEKGYLAK
jgi:putative hydrolases of HD superfamily